MTKTRVRSLGDLKPAKYNPRLLTPAREKQLVESYAAYGDLSGITVNKRTGHLIGGHQRIKTVKSAKATRVVTKPCRESSGTVEIGYVEADLERGTVRIPLRVVDWDRKREHGAMVAANAVGGEFDAVKLGENIRKLERSKFPIEHTGLDLVEAKRALSMFEHVNGRGEDVPDDGGGFTEIDADAIKQELTLVCPACKFRFAE